MIAKSLRSKIKLTLRARRQNAKEAHKMMKHSFARSAAVCQVRHQKRDDTLFKLHGWSILHAGFGELPFLWNPYVTLRYTSF